MTDTLQAISGKILDALNEAEREAEAQRLLDAYGKETSRPPYGKKPETYAAGRAILESDPHFQITVLITILKTEINARRIEPVKTALEARDLPWTTDELERLLETRRDSRVYFLGDVLPPVQRFVAQKNALTPKMTEILRQMQATADQEKSADARKIIARIGVLLGEEKSVLPEAGETWADAALADIAKLPEAEQTAWKKLFAQAQDCETAKPSPAWSKAARERLAEVGAESFRQFIAKWFGLVAVPAMRTNRQEFEGGRIYEHQVSSGSDRNISILKGLAWMCADRTEADIARALAKLIEAGVKKQPGIGPWATRAVNAAIWALTEMDSSEAVGQLSRLKMKITLRPSITHIENGLEAAAKKAGVTKSDLEDLSVPAYGFELNGTRREEFGESAGMATLTPTGDITIEWFGANGKPVKAPPADVKKNFADELKEFKADMDAAGKMLTAQKARFDGFYLPERVWKLKDWRGRFGNHPLLAHIAKRLIWHFSDAENKAQGLWNAETGDFADVYGKPIAWLTDETEVRLWHPIGFEVDVVLQWRDALQKAGIAQPFKQAYREVYLLTEAERRTETYSNRFAGPYSKTASDEFAGGAAELEKFPAPDGGRFLSARHAGTAGTWTARGILGRGHRRRLRDGHDRKRRLSLPVHRSSPFLPNRRGSESRAGGQRAVCGGIRRQRAAVAVPATGRGSRAGLLGNHARRGYVRWRVQRRQRSAVAGWRGAGSASQLLDGIFLRRPFRHRPDPPRRTGKTIAAPENRG